MGVTRCAFLFAEASAGSISAASTATTATSASAVTSGRISSRLSQNNSFGFGRGVLKCASSFSRRSPESFSAALGNESDSAG